MLEGPNKFFRYIQNAYLNNPKFAHESLAYLRVFFERNVKSNGSFTQLGQTYASSKWSSFSKSNIKVSLRQSFLYFVIPFIVLLIFLNLTFGKITFYATLSSFFNTEVILCSWNLLVEDINTRLVLIASSFYMVFIRLITSELQKTIISSNLNKPKPLPIIIPKKTNTFYRSPQIKTVQHFDMLRAPKSLFCVVNSLQLLNQPSFTKPLSGLAGAEFYPSTLMSLSVSKHNDLSTCSPLISGNDLDLFKKLFLKLENAVSLQDNRLKNLNKGAYHLSGLSIIDNIDLGKQKRWLTKNSILSNSLVQELYKLTESKKLLGLNLNMSDISSRNIFFSSKNGLMPKSELSNQLTTLNKTLFQSFTGSTTYSSSLHAWLLHPSLKNLNSNETSAFFNHKKYYLSNALINSISVSNLSSNWAVYSAAPLYQTQVLPNTLSSLFVIVAQQPTTLYFDELFPGESTYLSAMSPYGYKEYFSDTQYNSLLRNLDLKLAYLITSDVVGIDFNFYKPFEPTDFFVDTPKSFSVSPLS